MISFQKKDAKIKCDKKISSKCKADLKFYQKKEFISFIIALNKEQQKFK